MQALGFADLLIKNSYKGDKAANRTIASAFGEQANTFRSWKKSPKLGKTTDQRMQSYRAEVSGRHWDESSVLADIKVAGAKYLKVRKSAHQ
jgi:hypothetical protein